MERTIKGLLGLTTAGLLALSAADSHALVIQYQATDLADVTAGQDLWRYTYTVSGYSFQTGQGFDIYFSQSLYSNLSNPQPNTTDWGTAATTVPTPGTDMIFDAVALVNNPSLNTAFTIDFVWLGQGTPGSQSFDGYTPTTAGGLATFTEGRTGVPDSGSGLLLASLAFGVLLTPGVARRMSLVKA